MEARLDRAREDLGNVVKLEHVNVTIPDQSLATLFYVAGLGLTRDPYIMVSTNNMWINVGRSQFHLPTGKPQTLRGHTGIIVPDREELLARLGAVKKHLDGTRFEVREGNEFVDTSSPWGDRIRCHFPDAARFGRVRVRAGGGECQVAAVLQNAHREGGQLIFGAGQQRHHFLEELHGDPHHVHGVA